MTQFDHLVLLLMLLSLIGFSFALISSIVMLLLNIKHTKKLREITLGFVSFSIICLGFALFIK